MICNNFPAAQVNKFLPGVSVCRLGTLLTTKVRQMARTVSGAHLCCLLLSAVRGAKLQCKQPIPALIMELILCETEPRSGYHSKQYCNTAGSVREYCKLK